METKMYIRTYSDASEHERSEFVRMVYDGGAVEKQHVQCGIERPNAKMVFLTVEGKIQGVAARKVPDTGYRCGIESSKKAGFTLPEKDYPYELGYVAVKKKGCGFGGMLTAKVVELAEGCGMFATTSNEVMLKSILPGYGFEPVGYNWLGEPDKATGNRPCLQLLIKRPSDEV